jgi:hypothetical protein
MKASDAFLVHFSPSSAETKNVGDIHALRHISSCFGAKLIKHRHHISFTFIQNSLLLFEINRFQSS